MWVHNLDGPQNCSTQTSLRPASTQTCLLTLSKPTYVDHPTLYEYNPAAAASTFGAARGRSRFGSRRGVAPRRTRLAPPTRVGRAVVVVRVAARAIDAAIVVVVVAGSADGSD